MKNESYFSATPIGGGESKLMSASEFKNAFIINSADLGSGHFRYMAVIERRIVNIVQAPRLEVDVFDDDPVIGTSGLDQ